MSISHGNIARKQHTADPIVILAPVHKRELVPHVRDPGPAADFPPFRMRCGKVVVLFFLFLGYSRTIHANRPTCVWKLALHRGGISIRECEGKKTTAVEVPNPWFIVVPRRNAEILRRVRDVGYLSSVLVGVQPIIEGIHSHDAAFIRWLVDACVGGRHVTTAGYQAGNCTAGGANTAGVADAGATHKRDCMRFSCPVVNMCGLFTNGRWIYSYIIQDNK